jgi:hypothetical protein
MAKHKYIETPVALLELFEKYKTKVHENPRYNYQLAKDGSVVPVPLRVPLTMEGFRIFCYKEIGSIKHYFENTDNSYVEYLPICSHIREEIRSDQIEGGMVGQYNASITQRLNGLVDKQENTNLNKEVPLFPDVQENDSNQ